MIAVLTLTISCTPSYIGQKAKGVKIINKEKSNHVHDSSRDIIFDYDLYIDHVTNEIKVNGTVMIKNDVFSGSWDVKEIDLYFYLLGFNDRVLKREHLFVGVNGEFADAKFNFSGTFDYNTGYKSIAHGYKARVSM